MLCQNIDLENHVSEIVSTDQEKELDNKNNHFHFHTLIEVETKDIRVKKLKK